MARVITLMLAAIGAAGAAHAQQRAFSAGWMAQKNIAQGQAIATGRLPNGLPVSSLNTPSAQQQQAREQLQRSLGNLNLAAQSIAAQQAAQAAARQAALDDPSSVPDGLANGGLRVDTNSLTAGWLNAQAPVQSQGTDGRTTVTIQQTGDRAILNWETFNVGKRTTVDFKQQADWAVLNRVNDPQARPSQIQGQIKADGTVLIANRNGIVFSGSSQTDTRNLVAAAARIGDDQFKARGIYSAQESGAYTPSFTDANGKVEVQAGARINTAVPTTVTQGGGYALLLGKEVSNAGTITTPRGQVQMAAGDFFIVRPGQSTTGNQYATTRGNEVAPQFNADSAAGAVTNTGLLQAPEGDITLAGRKVMQDGVAVSTTTVDTRGTIHLLNSASDKLGSVTVTSRGLNAILLDDQNGRTALDSQRDALIADSAVQDLARRTAASGGFDNLARLDDRRDQSRIEIVSGGGVVFEGGSTTLATGGQIAVAASNGRSTVANGARLDVSGAVGVQVAMSSNNVEINIQGNEQRDAPLNRDTTLLNNSNVWIDRRKLLRVAAGVGGYDKERWYTPGGLLEVGGYLGLQGHTVGEWGAQGGSVVFAGNELVAQAGSNINLSGGTLDVQTGMIKQSWIKGADGRLYEVSSAPADVQYTGLYKGYEDAHKRWGDKTTGFFYNPLIGPQQRLENGYTVGRDAGQLIVSTGAAVLEGDITSNVYQGPRQTIKRDDGMDGYGQSHDAAALAAQLILGSYTSAFNTDAKNGPTGVFHNLAPTMNEIVFGTGGKQVTDTLQDGNASAPLPEELQGKARVDSSLLDGFGLGAMLAAAKQSLTVDGALTVTPGGTIALYAPQVRVNADLTARSGHIALGNVQTSITASGKTLDVALPTPSGQDAPQVTVARGVTLDASGLWSNLQGDPDDATGLPHVDGGSVSIRDTGAVTLSQGSAIDVSSGAALLSTGALRGGTGGDITLAAAYVTDLGATPGAALLTLEGALRGYGVDGGGTLHVQSGAAVGIGGALLDTPGLLQAGQAAPANLRLLQDYKLAAGERVPMDVVVTISKRPAGYTVTDAPVLSYLQNGAAVVTQAEWVVPPGSIVTDARAAYLEGTRIPAGTALLSLKLGVGATIPPDVFPDGVPIYPTPQYLQAGTVLGAALTLPAGSMLSAGAVLPRAAGVGATAQLSSSLFQSGFAHYLVSANDGITVLPGTQVDVKMPVLWPDLDAVRALPTGARLSDRLATWTPPLYLEDAVHATLTQRGGAGIALDAGSRVASAGTNASLIVGTGARIGVDPGQDIALWSNGGQVTVDGRLDAWGGSISIASLPGPLAYRASPSRSIWIGEHAVLDAAARPHVAYDIEGRAYGIAPDGGTIDIGLSDAFVVIRPGAVLDASGAFAEVDGAAGGSARQASQPLALAGNGGSIGLHSYMGMAIDGSLSARAGGAGAAGGSLTLEMANRNYSANSEAISMDFQTMHNITLVQQRPGNDLPAELRPGVSDPTLKVGTAVLGVDQVQAGGFDALTLSARDLFVFDGDIDLSLGRSLNLRNGFLTVAAQTPDAQVRLAAPTIRLDGGNWTGTPNYYTPGIATARPAEKPAGASALTLTADLIDIFGTVQSGVSGTHGDGTTIAAPPNPNNPSSTVAFTADGFASVTLRSDGDIRFNREAAFVVPLDLSIEAAQLYPVSNQRGMLLAGFYSDNTGRTAWNPDASLVIRSNGHAAPMPDSVFGRLVMIAPTLDQGGIVRAPLGSIALNDSGGSGFLNWITTATLRTDITADMRLILRNGSVTSVSAAGLSMPYGGTSDGVSYRGADGTLYQLGVNAVDYLVHDGGAVRGESFSLPQGIALGGGSVLAEAGAVLDLSGGGELRGAGFVSGRGGSVDVLTTPLANANPRSHGQSQAGNAVYAIVPGYASSYAPTIDDKGAGDPALGRQITIGAGVPGLPAGTYTLLPASFALMPNAWRIEVGPPLSARAGTGPVPGALATAGTWATSGTLSTANTGIRDSLPSQVLLTSADTVRHLSQYNETGYADFAAAQAAQFGNVRPMLPADGKILRFRLVQNDEVVPLQFDGTARLEAAAGGTRGQVSVLGDKPIEIVGGAAQPTAGAISISSDTLSALNAGTLSIGGVVVFNNGASTGDAGARISFSAYGTGGVVRVHDGASLRAGQIFLLGQQVDVDGGAVLDTRGMGQPSIDSSLGFLYANDGPAVLALSNGWLDFLPATGTGKMVVSDGASLLSEGTIAFAAPGGLALGDVNLGARYLTVAQDQINIGTAASLAAAQTAGSLQPGWQLTQDTLNRLLRPSSSAGVPALERLSLTAGGAFNFYGSLTLDTGDSSAQMVFNTPAFYGLGAEDDTVRIATRNFVWNGLATGNGRTTSPYANVPPVAVRPGGPGTGRGSLVIDAQTVQFGYDAMSQPQRQVELNRLALGFGAVAIHASGRVTANNKGALSVGQSRDADGTLHGGALTIATPLLTGEAGAAMRYVAGGAIDVSTLPGTSAADTASIADLGASLTLEGRSITLNTAVALPSGVLTLRADGDVRLGDDARIDLSGRAVTFYDITKYSWGGDVTMTSTGGSIAPSAGSRIDVSAAHNDAGSLTVSAAAGSATLAGTLAATGGGAGFSDGRFGLTVQRLADTDFAALNRQLNDAGFFGARRFVVKQGDLTVGTGVRARQVSISTDGGSLTVDGTIDASSEGPGQIDLAASNDLRLTGRAVLDAHASRLATDSYGAPIDAANRAKVSLRAVNGTVSLDTGVTIDLSSPDGMARGRLEIDAPRVGSTGPSATGPDAPANATGGNIAISAAGPLNIRGAQSIALNGVARYTNAPVDPNDADGQIVDQAYLDLIDSDSRAFDNAARGNAGLQARIAGLAAYAAAFHLRPGVEIDSRTPDGNLTVKGDLDLSGYRYGPDADRNPASARYGAGEPMSLALRAGGDLNIHGSINDGFAPPPATPDDGGWQIRQQVLLTGQATTRDVTFDAPFNPDWGDAYYLFPSVMTGIGYPVVVSGSVSDGTGAVYLPGDSIPGFLYGTITVAAGTVLVSDVPGGADIVLSGSRPEPGRMWAIAPMLAAGSLSASIRLVSGADLAAADTRSLQTGTQLSGRGNMVLDDLHLAATQAAPGSQGPVQPSEALSVIRTGTGDLDLYVGGDYKQNSLFGVYTAGTSVAGTGAESGWNAARATVPDATDPRGRSVLSAGNSAYENTLGAQRLWFTENGGDFTLSAQGDVRGYLTPSAVSVGDWLWRQGGAELGQRTAWGLSFGSYVLDGGISLATLGLAGYAGVGALGGGNAVIRVGGNIGVAGDETKGLLASVGGSGRMTDAGTLLQTGGGTLDVKAGGLVSGGLYVNLRGDTQLEARDVGGLLLSGFATANNQDPRAADPYIAHSSVRSGAVNFAPGDGTLRVDTLGDLVLGSVIDPGRVGERSETMASAGGASGSAASWFTLWTDRTALALFSAGGNASPFGPHGDTIGLIATSTLPASLSMVAAGGSIYYSTDNAFMAPSPYGHLDLLARGLVSGDESNSGSTSGSFIGPLGTSAAAMSTPRHPAWQIVDDTPQRNLVGTNHWRGLDAASDRLSLYDFNLVSGGAYQGAGGTLFMFGPNTVSDSSMAGSGVMSHVYALTGDVIKVQIGQAINVNWSVGQSATLYQASKPLRMLAGGDIVNSSGLIVQDAVTDVSMIAAQGDVIFSNFSIAGPGTLEVSAGGQVYQGNIASLTSMGALVPGDLRPGAGIVVQSGLGKGLPGQGATDVAGFARQYLDPARAIDPSAPLADQPGQVVKTYDAELAQWLKDRYGYLAASALDALSYFQALAPEQQRIFVRQVFYAELTAGGREYNAPDSKRFGSYLRGRNAIAALFPEQDAAGQAIVRRGDLTLFQGAPKNAGIRTIAGGDVQILTPGGKTILGVEGVVPSNTPDAVPAGLLTQGEGSIDMYSKGSILLGLSRIMTTFGGDILAWSAEGDINAGRGSKTTLVYTPPKREYDTLGNVKLSPNVPSTGAGIATLDPIPEVPPGDVDLIAPLGTIDAGEAGIRVSGNVNLAALQVVNAANIQVKGESAGLPVVASVNVSALTNASAAASQAAMAAQDTVQRERTAARQALPSVFTVRVLGFGNEAPDEKGADSLPRPGAQSGVPRPYNASSVAQIVGLGNNIDPRQWARLTDDERRSLQRDR